MKTVFKLTSVLIIQAMALGNYAWAGELVFAGQEKVQTKCLSPQLAMTSAHCKDIFLREPIIAALERHRGEVFWAAKSLGIAPSEIIRLIPTKKIEQIKEKANAEIEERRRFIQALGKAGGNVAKAARSLRTSRNKVEQVVPENILNSIRLNSKNNEKERLIQAIKKYCLEEGWSRKVARELGLPGKPISETQLFERMKQLGIKGREIRKQRELQALKEEKGNVIRAAKKLGIPRNRFWKYREIAERLREEASQEKEDQRILKLFWMLEEAKGDRKLMQEKLGFTKRRLHYQLKRYGRTYFPAIIAERLKLIDQGLDAFRQEGQRVKTQDIDPLRRFFYTASDRMGEYYEWMETWEEELQLRFLPDEIIETIMIYKSLLRRLENNLLNVQREKYKVMASEIDKNIAIVDTFYRENKDKSLRVYETYDLEKLFLKKRIISGLKQKKGYIPWASKFTGIGPRQIRRLMKEDELNEIKKEADKKEKQRVVLVLEETGGNVLAAAKKLKIDKAKIRKLVPAKELDAIRREKDEEEKQKTIAAVKKHCLYKGAIEKAAEDLKIPAGTLAERMLKYDIRVFELRREVELEMLKETGGNVKQAADNLKISRARFDRHHQEQKVQIKQKAEAEKQNKRAELFFSLLKETGGHRPSMIRESKLSEKTVYTWLKQYGSAYFPAMVEEKLESIDELLLNLKDRLKNQQKPVKKQIAAHDLEKFRSYLYFVSLWSEKPQQVFLSVELNKKVLSYKKMLKDLEDIFDVLVSGFNSVEFKPNDISSVIEDFYRAHWQELSQIQQKEVNRLNLIDELNGIENALNLRKSNAALLHQTQLINQAI